MSGTGNDTLDSGLGSNTADYSAAARGVNANLAAGTATVVTATNGYITSQPAMLAGENGFNAYALVTSGLTLASTGALNALSGACVHEPRGRGGDHA
jgi:hypothetical protein